MHASSFPCFLDVQHHDPQQAKGSLSQEQLHISFNRLVKLSKVDKSNLVDNLQVLGNIF